MFVNTLFNQKATIPQLLAFNLSDNFGRWYYGSRAWRLYQIQDTFGLFDDKEKVYEIPVHDNTDKLQACVKRASEINSPVLAWSGGIDSTFLLALFCSLDKNIKLVLFTDTGTDDIPDALYRYVKNNFELTEINDTETQYEPVLLTGNLNDFLFYPEQRVLNSWVYSRENGKRVVKSIVSYKERSIEEWCEPFLSHSEIDKVSSAVKKFGMPVTNNLQIARFVNIAFQRNIALNHAHMFSFPHVKHYSFYDTQKFFNIACTQYWDANAIYPHNKEMETAFISKVFGTDFGVHKNG